MIVASSTNYTLWNPKDKEAGAPTVRIYFTNADNITLSNIKQQPFDVFMVKRCNNDSLGFFYTLYDIQ